MTESMIEKVARAIDECPAWPAKTYRQRVARAAIEATREPTGEMRRAVEATWGPRNWAVYSHAIDAALNEQEAG